MAEHEYDFPLYVFHQGKNYQAYKFMCPSYTVQNGVSGWVFRVWAPEAVSVSVVGDFNCWDRTANPMEKISVGVWSCFVAGIEEYTIYKFSVEQYGGRIVNKADPYALHAETAPANGSRTCIIDGYPWTDGEWLKARESYVPYNRPLNIYEMHIGSWRTYPDGSPFSYRKLAEELIPYLKKMRYTHVELLPITEYPFDGSWGYQVTGMYAPTSRYGTPKDFMFFVDSCHAAGIGVIIDWVASHFPKDEFGLYRFDGKPLYEYADPTKGEHPEWGTVVYDYGRNEVRSFLISSANFWVEMYHVDGIRVDAVASMLYLDYGRNPGEWIPNAEGGNINLEVLSFLKELNSAVLSQHKGAIMIAEESTDYPNITRPTYDGGLGFNFKWNMGWMNDTLKYVSADPFFRKDMHEKMTFSIMYAFKENYILPLSHDEVVHGKASLVNKMPGYYPDKFGGLMAYLGYMYAHPGKKLLFMGSEFGQFIEWNYKQGLDWLLLDYPAHNGIQSFVKDLNAFYCDNPCMWELDTGYEGFKWLQVADKHNNVFAFMRLDAKGEYVIAIMNFSSQTLPNYWIGVPDYGVYYAALDSRYLAYNNGNREEHRTFKADLGRTGDQPFEYHIPVDIDPFSVLYIKLKTKLKPPVAKTRKKAVKQTGTVTKGEQLNKELTADSAADKKN